MDKNPYAATPTEQQSQRAGFRWGCLLGSFLLGLLIFLLLFGSVWTVQRAPAPLPISTPPPAPAEP